MFKMVSPKVARGLKSGRVVRVRNARRSIPPLLIGEGVPTRVNANLGASPGNVSLKKEVLKARVAVEYGADTLMDLSVGCDLRRMRRALIKRIPVPWGTVPVYEAFSGKSLDVSLQDILKVVERQARDGVEIGRASCRERV